MFQLLDILKVIKPTSCAMEAKLGPARCCLSLGVPKVSI
jgi:hypothetical protein